MFNFNFIFSTTNQHDEENIDIIHIFVHGTADGIHAYASKEKDTATLTGLLNHWHSVFSYSKKFIKELYQNKQLFLTFKQRGKWLLETKFPMIMGLCSGLHEITHHFDQCEKIEKCNECISAQSYQSIFTIFQSNEKKINQNNNQKYYMFNWVGNLNSFDRHTAATQFAEDLIKLQTKHPKSKINFYGHSHGGNVILETLAIVHQENYNLNVNNICTLAMPISRKTNQWIKQICFNNLYNFYSNYDKVQIADFTFDLTHSCFHRHVKKINNNIYNIEVKRVDGHIVDHGTFYHARIITINNKNQQKIVTPVIADIPFCINKISHLKKQVNIAEYTAFITTEYIYYLN